MPDPIDEIVDEDGLKVVALFQVSPYKTIEIWSKVAQSQVQAKNGKVTVGGGWQSARGKEGKREFINCERQSSSWVAPPK